MGIDLLTSDCIEALVGMDDNSVDSIVTDPPYGLAFMGKKWDYDVPSIEVWKECLRVLKPGGHALIACGTRTQHRMAVNIEDAGFEIRDVITWLYGSGFPKSLDVSKAIDKAAGAEREVVAILHRQGFSPTSGGRYQLNSHDELQEKTDTKVTAPSTDAAKQWAGWGTALKPACEFWTLCRKPLSESTVAKNVLKHGTGGINVDGCRIPGAIPVVPHPDFKSAGGFTVGIGNNKRNGEMSRSEGRFPANLILDEEAGAILDEQSGERAGSKKKIYKNSQPRDGRFGEMKALDVAGGFDDSGGASRFFYCAKASKSERGEENAHPTVKPIKLMRYLCRLITPPNGIVLDPFMGSGSTGVAALAEGFQFKGIEREAEYVEIARRRMEGDPSENSLSL